MDDGARGLVTGLNRFQHRQSDRQFKRFRPLFAGESPLLVAQVSGSRSPGSTCVPQPGAISSPLVSNQSRHLHYSSFNICTPSNKKGALGLRGVQKTKSKCRRLVGVTGVCFLKQGQLHAGLELENPSYTTSPNPISSSKPPCTLTASITALVSGPSNSLLDSSRSPDSHDFYFGLGGAERNVAGSAVAVVLLDTGSCIRFQSL